MMYLSEEIILSSFITNNGKLSDTVYDGIGSLTMFNC